MIPPINNIPQSPPPLVHPSPLIIFPRKPQAWVSTTTSGMTGYGPMVRRVVVVGEVSSLRIVVNGEPVNHPALA